MAADTGWKPEKTSEPFGELIRSMPKTMAFVDVVAYSRPALQGQKTERGYAAFVLTVGGIEMVSLGDAMRIDALATNWLESIESQRASAAGQTLSELVWKPIANCLPSDVTTLVVSPSGTLAGIPWCAFKHNGRYLIEEYTLTIVPDGHLLLEQLNKTGVSQVRKLQRVVAFAHDLEDSSTKEREEPLPILPGTHRELNSLDEFLADAILVQLRGQHVTAPELLKQIENAQLLHIATHGYFLPRDVHAGSENVRQSRFSKVMARNPYFAAGVVLSSSLTGESGVYEVLTAEQVANSSLSSLELVVLSACNSGVGKSRGSEGMYSMQRAFHASGAQNVVVSLWPVDDDYTSLIMRRFYSHLLQGEQTVADALRLAQLDVMSEAGASTKVTRGPRFSSVRVEGISDGSVDFPIRHWAGFVVSGLGATKLSSKSLKAEQ